MTPRLHNTVEQAYEAFGSRRLGNVLEVCHCPSCMTTEVAQSILDTPLRKLSHDQIAEYTNSAHDWSEQFLCLLPRYMELNAQGSRPSNIGSIDILSRFRHAPPGSLSPSEISALSDWFIALFEETLCSPIATDELDRALSCRQPWWKGFGYDVCDVIEIALPTLFDTAQFRELWAQSENREAHLRLASTIAFGVGSEHFRDDWSPSEKAASARAEWLEWFTYAGHREKLRQALERESDPLAQELLLQAI